MRLQGLQGATLTVEVVVQVRDAPVANGNGRLANLAGSEGGHCEERASRLRVRCECVVEGVACEQCVCVV